MKASELAQNLNLKAVFESNKDITMDGVYIGDLLSIVMSKAKQNYIWITIQTHINIVAVAELLDLACIIVVENMEIEEDTIDKAKELDIPIFKTNESAFEIACKINSLGLI